ncbi:MAG: hypothetical protein CMJ75_05115 [Planctomycetaceae bacterium]|nr:hypothetical protein [Planctomycetaceae bacterium]
MSKSISMVTAGLLTIGILVVGGPVQAGLDDASVGLNGTANFTGAGGPDANIDYVVVYRAGGVTLDHLNDNVFTGVNLTTADAAGGSGEAAGLGTMQAFDETAKIALFYQIDSASGDGEITRLAIRDFGFAPTSAGYFEDTLLAIDTEAETGTISTSAGLKTPNQFRDGITLANDGSAGFRWQGLDTDTGTGLTDSDSAPLFYVTFSDANSTGWAQLISNNEITGGGGTRTGSLPSPNPEPGSLALLGAAVAGFGGFRRFRRRRNAEQQPEDTEADTATTPEVD